LVPGGFFLPLGQAAGNTVLTDTHCHLDYDKFDPDRAAVLERARQAGVAHILIPGLTLASSQSAVRMAESDALLFAAVGMHPTSAPEFDRAQLDDFHRLASHPRVKAVGEIGLDYYWDAAPPDLQKSVLNEQLGLAAGLGLPVVLHFREKGDSPDGPCASDLLAILENWVRRLKEAGSPLADRPGVLHSFSGSLTSARRALSLGFYLGVTGPVTYNQRRQELIASLPLERLLIETDAPFLAPSPRRGRRNEPANVSLIADKISTLHACTPEEVASVTSTSANALFRWDD
jgi:TatD DNase family protein